jgi:hypothetical protein
MPVKSGIHRRNMKFARFSAGGILGIIFRHIKESPRTLAELYVFRDRSLVYKWLHDSATPPKALVPGIVAFVMEKTCEPVRLSMQKELGDYIRASGLPPGIVAQLNGTIPFQKYMEDILNFAISLPTSDKPVTTTFAPRHEIPEGRSIPFTELALALSAVLGSGIIWNGINRFLEWTYYMGGDGREPRGVSAAVWGLTVTMPIILAVMVSKRRFGGRAPAKGGLALIAVPVLYSLSGMVGSLAFYDTRLRFHVEGLHLGYGFQELVIGFLFALVVSLLPLGVITIARMNAGESRPRGFMVLGYALLPSFLVVAAVVFTFVVDRPIAELEQLRGLLAGLMLRTGMFLAARSAVFTA